MRSIRPALARTLLASAVATAGLLSTGVAEAAPAETAPADTTQTRTATPVLTMSGSTSGYSTFYLARKTTITINATKLESAQANVAGNGRSVGVVLNRLGAGQQPSVGVFTSNGCFVRACQPNSRRKEMVSGSPYVTSATGPSTVTLPAGRYNATLVTDGAPVTARIKLGGLARSITLHPKATAKVSYSKITGVSPEQPGHVYSTGGRSYTFGSPAYLLAQNISRTAAGGAQQDGHCVILGEAPPSNIYAPGCPTADPTAEGVYLPVTQTQGPDQTDSVELGSIFLVAPLPANRLINVGSYVVSAVPLLETKRLQLAVQLPLRAERSR